MDRAAEPFRWLPSITVAALAWLALFPIVSVDVPYHLATGRRILEEGAIPQRGVGSATFGQQAWHDNEWGFQVLAALLGSWEKDPSGVWVLTRKGIVALVLFRALCLAATLALLSAQMAGSGVGPLTRSVALALAAFLTFGNLFWAVRPQMLSYLALAAVAYLLQRDRQGSRWSGAATLLVVALWANVHGAFVIGIALLACEAAGETAGAWSSSGRPETAVRARRLWLLTLLAPLFACLNPHGYHQLIHPFLYVLRPEIHAGNAEWTRPDFLHLPLFVLTLALLVLATAAAGNVRPGDLFRGVAFTLLLFSAVRHLPLAALILVPLLAAGVRAAAARGGWRAHLEPTGPGAGGPGVRLVAALLLVAGIVGLSGAFTRSGARFVTLWPRFEVRPVEPMPEAAMRLLARSGIGGTVFNEYRFGGFLMFGLYPAERVFMDGRNDLYARFRDEVYNPLLETRPGWNAAWREAVERFDVRSVMIDADQPLAGALRTDAGWMTASEQDGIVLFVKDSEDSRGRLAEAWAVTGGRAP